MAADAADRALVDAMTIVTAVGDDDPAVPARIVAAMDGEHLPGITLALANLCAALAHHLALATDQDPSTLLTNLGLSIARNT